MATTNLHKTALNHCHLPGISSERLTKTFCLEIHFVFSVGKICQGCNKIEVQGLKALMPELFTTYAIEPDLVNGHSHYTSLDGKNTIAFNNEEMKMKWKIQPVAHR